MQQTDVDDFTKVKFVEFPRNIVAGHGVLGTVRKMCDDDHVGRTGTIITGTKTMEAAGKEVLDNMDGYDMDVCTVGEATMDNVNMVIERIREFGSEFVLAVGGGSKIDVS